MNMPMTIDDDLRSRAQPFVDSGQFETIEAVLRAGLEALADEQPARDDEAHNAWLRKMIAEADADPRPPVSMEEAFRIARGESPE